MIEKSKKTSEVSEKKAEPAKPSAANTLKSGLAGAKESNTPTAPGGAPPKADSSAGPSSPSSSKAPGGASPPAPSRPGDEIRSSSELQEKRKRGHLPQVGMLDQLRDVWGDGETAGVSPSRAWSSKIGDILTGNSGRLRDLAGLSKPVDSDHVQDPHTQPLKDADAHKPANLWEKLWGIPAPQPKEQHPATESPAEIARLGAKDPQSLQGDYRAPADSLVQHNWGEESLPRLSEEARSESARKATQGLDGLLGANQQSQIQPKGRSDKQSQPKAQVLSSAENQLKGQEVSNKPEGQPVQTVSEQGQASPRQQNASQPQAAQVKAEGAVQPEVLESQVQTSVPPASAPGPVFARLPNEFKPPVKTEVREDQAKGLPPATPEQNQVSPQQQNQLQPQLKSEGQLAPGPQVKTEARPGLEPDRASPKQQAELKKTEAPVQAQPAAFEHIQASSKQPNEPQPQPKTEGQPAPRPQVKTEASSGSEQSPAPPKQQAEVPVLGQPAAKALEQSQAVPKLATELPAKPKAEGQPAPGPQVKTEAPLSEQNPASPKQQNQLKNTEGTVQGQSAATAFDPPKVGGQPAPAASEQGKTGYVAQERPVQRADSLSPDLKQGAPTPGTPDPSAKAKATEVVPPASSQDDTRVAQEKEAQRLQAEQAARALQSQIPASHPVAHAGKTEARPVDGVGALKSSKSAHSTKETRPASHQKEGKVAGKAGETQAADKKAREDAIDQATRNLSGAEKAQVEHVLRHSKIDDDLLKQITKDGFAINVIDGDSKSLKDAQGKTHAGRYDYTDNKIRLSEDAFRDPQELKKVLNDELGHRIDDQLRSNPETSQKWSQLMRDYAAREHKDSKIDQNAASNQGEFGSEVISAYLQGGKDEQNLKNSYPELYNVVKNTVGKYDQSQIETKAHGLFGRFAQALGAQQNQLQGNYFSDTIVAPREAKNSGDNTAIHALTNKGTVPQPQAPNPVGTGADASKPNKLKGDDTPSSSKPPGQNAGQQPPAQAKSPAGDPSPQAPTSPNQDPAPRSPNQQSTVASSNQGGPAQNQPSPSNSSSSNYSGQSNYSNQGSSRSNYYSTQGSSYNNSFFNNSNLNSLMDSSLFNQFEQSGLSNMLQDNAFQSLGMAQQDLMALDQSLSQAGGLQELQKLSQGLQGLDGLPQQLKGLDGLKELAPMLQDVPGTLEGLGKVQSLVDRAQNLPGHPKDFAKNPEVKSLLQELPGATRQVAGLTGLAAGGSAIAGQLSSLNQVRQVGDNLQQLGKATQEWKGLPAKLDQVAQALPVVKTAQQEGSLPSALDSNFGQLRGSDQGRRDERPQSVINPSGRSVLQGENLSGLRGPGGEPAVQVPGTTRPQPVAPAEAPSVRPQSGPQAQIPAVRPQPGSHAETPTGGPQPGAHAEAPAVRPQPGAQGQIPAVRPQPGAHAEAPPVRPQPGAHAETPAVRPQPGAPAEAPAVRPQPGAQGQIPAVRPQPGAHAETPAVRPQPGAHAEAPAVRPQPGAHAEAPAVRPQPGAHAEAPPVRPQPGAQGQIPAVRPQAGAHAEAPAVRPQPGAHAEAPAVRPQPGAHAESPVVRSQPGAHAEAPPVRLQPGAHAETPPVRPQPGGQAEAPAVRPQPRIEVPHVRQPLELNQGVQRSAIAQLDGKMTERLQTAPVVARQLEKLPQAQNNLKAVVNGLEKTSQQPKGLEALHRAAQDPSALHKGLDRLEQLVESPQDKANVQNLRRTLEPVLTEPRLREGLKDADRALKPLGESTGKQQVLSLKRVQLDTPATRELAQQLREPVTKAPMQRVSEGISQAREMERATEAQANLMPHLSNEMTQDLGESLAKIISEAQAANRPRSLFGIQLGGGARAAGAAPAAAPARPSPAAPTPVAQPAAQTASAVTTPAAKAPPAPKPSVGQPKETMSKARIDAYRQTYETVKEQMIGKAGKDHAWALVYHSRDAEGAKGLTDTLESNVVKGGSGKMQSWLKDMTKTPDSAVALSAILANVANVAPDRMMGIMLLTTDGAGGKETVGDAFNKMSQSVDSSLRLSHFLEKSSQHPAAARGLAELLEGQTEAQGDSWKAAGRTAETFRGISETVGGARRLTQTLENLGEVEGGNRLVARMINRMSREPEGANSTLETLQNLAHDKEGAGQLGRVLSRASESRDGARDLLHSFQNMAKTNAGKQDVARLFVRLAEGGQGARLLANFVKDGNNSGNLAGVFEQLNQNVESKALLAHALDQMAKNPRQRSNYEVFAGRVAASEALQEVVKETIGESDRTSETTEVIERQPELARLRPLPGRALENPGELVEAAQHRPDLQRVSESWRTERPSAVESQAPAAASALAQAEKPADTPAEMRNFRPGDVYSEETLRHARICGDCGGRTTSLGLCPRCATRKRNSQAQAV